MARNNNCKSLIETNTGPIFASFVTFDSRLQSFRGWRHDIIQSPESLARAGFFYCGSEDRVICFYCAKALWQWEETDDPWIEHALHSPKCAFLLLNRNARSDVVIDIDYISDSSSCLTVEEKYKKCRYCSYL